MRFSPTPHHVLAGAAAVLAFAALPAASADAAYTSKVLPDAVVMTGNSSPDQLAIGATGPSGNANLRHNRFGDPGFASDEDFDTEKPGVQKATVAGLNLFQVNAARGDDVVDFDPRAAGLLFPVTVSIDGGDGDDVITGTDSPDLIRGGFGDDRLAGAFNDEGDAPDSLDGGPGDDVFEWREDDESDLIDGGDGTDVLDVRTGAAPDALAVTQPRPVGKDLSIAPPGSRFNITRTGDDFELKTTGVEGAQIATGGGDDSVAGDPSLTSVALSVDGGAGADKLTGSGAADLLDGGDGPDTIGARDGQADLVRCGDGADSAIVDAPGLDAASGCETVDALPAPSAPLASPEPGAPTAPSAPAAPVPVRAALPRIVAKRGRAIASAKGRLTLTLACPAGGADCLGDLVLTTARPVMAGRARLIATLGRARYRIAPGATQKLSVKLPRGIGSLASRRGTIAARAVASSRSVDGLTAAAASKLTIALKR